MRVNVKRRLAAIGLRATDFCVRCGVSTTSLYAFERGDARSSLYQKIEKGILRAEAEFAALSDLQKKNAPRYRLGYLAAAQDASRGSRRCLGCGRSSNYPPIAFRHHQAASHAEP
jgi:hypothetical protein